MSAKAPTDRTRLRRFSQNAHYDAAAIARVLDAAYLCHVGYLADGKPVVIPTAHWRIGAFVYWHGSAASQSLRRQVESDVCLTVTILDGLVMARSAFEHSMNYRSVMAFGKAVAVTDPAAKLAALEKFVEKLSPGRWETLRPVTSQELKATNLLRLELSEASAKIRAGNMDEPEADWGHPAWAGVWPLRLVAGEPIAHESVTADIFPTGLRQLEPAPWPVEATRSL